MANNFLNKWKFKIHWNKFEWVNPRNRNERKNPFCVSSNFFFLTDNNKTTHWVGNSKLKPLDKNDLFKRKKVIDDIQASLTVTKI